MNLFEQFQNHEIFQTLTNKLDEIEKAINNESYNEAQKESLFAFQQILTIIKANLESKALPMVPSNVLANLNSAIANLSIAILTNINGYPNQYTNLLDWYKRIPTIEKKGELKESFNSIIDNFIQNKEKISSDINIEIKDFQNKQEQQFLEWKSEKEKMQEEINELKSQNDDLKNKITLFEQTIQNQQTKINNLIENFKADYNEKAENFEERFTDKETEHNKKIEELLVSQKNNANMILEHMQQRRDDVEELWGIIGQAAISGNSQNYADKAKKMADIMMWITLGIMLVVVAVLAITTTIDLISGKFNYIHFMYKIIGSTIFLVPAFYCSNISKRQRDREFQLRDFEVKTAALEPFMENMILENNNPDKSINKDQVKLELTKAFFGQQFSEQNKNDCVLIPKEIAKILNSFAKKCNLNINLGDKQ